MKGGAGGGSSYNVPAKRRWKGLVILVLGLGVLSMLVHLVFLFGLPKGFHSYSGYTEELLSSESDGLTGYSQRIESEITDTSKDYQSRHVDVQITRPRPTLPKETQDLGGSSAEEANSNPLGQDLGGSSVEEANTKPLGQDLGGSSVEEANTKPLGQDLGGSSVEEANTKPLGQDLGGSSVEEANTTPLGQDVGSSSVKEANAPPMGQDLGSSSVEEANATPVGQNLGSNSVEEAKNITHAPPLPPDSPKLRAQANTARSVGKSSVHENIRGNEGSVPENIRDIGDRITLCESKFGSYCLWQQEHREIMKDRTVKKMKDLLYVARAYYPSIAKLPALDKLSHELKQNIQEFERVLSEATTDKDLPPLIEKNIEKMEAVLIRTKSCNVDCINVDKKFRQLVDLTEDEADFHMKQSAFLFQLATQTMPKSLHCLSMRLTVEYFRSPTPGADESLTNKYSDPDLYHYVMFSNNVLASSVAINSTVMNARDTSTLVFHVMTEKQNYFAMKLWYYQNIYKEAVVQVLDIEDLNLSGFSHLFLPQEFRVSFRKVDKFGKAWSQTEYLSVFSPAHHLLPDVFPTLKKVVIMDDDVIVQRDLSSLWSINMGGKVNGAVLLCTVRLLHLKNYLGLNNSSEDSCAWMSGLNVIDLQRWRELDLTKTYERFINEQVGKKQELSEGVVLRATLLTYSGLVYALEDNWMVSGLGNNYNLDHERTEKAAALHYNGIMKPWLELGIPKYERYWRKFLNPEIPFLNDCNVNP